MEGTVGHAREAGINMSHVLLVVIICDHYICLPCSSYVAEVAVDVVVVVCHRHSLILVWRAASMATEECLVCHKCALTHIHTHGKSVFT